MAEGHLEQQINPAHKRAMLLGATELGRSAIYALSERQHIWANAVAAGIETKRIEDAVAVLRQVSARLENMQTPKADDSQTQ